MIAESGRVTGLTPSSSTHRTPRKINGCRGLIQPVGSGVSTASRHSTPRRIRHESIAPKPRSGPRRHSCARSNRTCRPGPADGDERDDRRCRRRRRSLLDPRLTREEGRPRRHALRQGTVHRLLTYHVLAKKVASPAAVAAAKKNASVKTVEGESIKLSLKGGKLYLNGNSQVIVADMAASNGVIHAI